MSEFSGIFSGIGGDLAAAISAFPRISSRYKTQLQKRLAAAGFETVSQVIAHTPLSYDHRDVITSLAAATAQNEKVLVRARVLSREQLRLPKTGRSLLVARIADESASAELHCYGRDFLRAVLFEGAEIFVWGKFAARYGKRIASDFELVTQESRRNALIPRYGLSGTGISQAMFWLCVQASLEVARVPNFLAFCTEEWADFFAREKQDEQARAAAHSFAQKITGPEACRMLHVPKNAAEAAAAREYFAFFELVLFLVFGRLSEKNYAKNHAGGLTNSAREHDAPTIDHHILDDKPSASASDAVMHTRAFAHSLPFVLTRGQTEAVNEIARDMQQGEPMRRLLQGDVGAGKTAVALCCAAFAVFRGGQACFLAPSEALAQQHAANLRSLCEPSGIRVALLTGSVVSAQRRAVLRDLAAGEIDILVGTHAAYGDEVRYKNLTFAVIDEQHRFGVAQRAQALSKGQAVHALLMSATPIPRSLALTLYGGLEISTLRERPALRSGAATRLVLHKNSEKIYPRIAEKLSRGEQAFFVFPFIDEEDDEEEGGGKKAFGRVGAISAEGMFPHIRASLAPHECALLHSKLPSSSRAQILARFARGEIAALVSTTIIEVGIDVPNAAAMCVFDAQRFGLAALHQLRGRVGRGETPGEVFLIYREPLTEAAKERLKVLYEHDDGFLIAEKDLQLRGPGDINQLGLRQSGALLFSFFDMARDTPMIEVAHKVAQRVLREDPQLLDEKHAVLRLRAAAQAEKTGVAA